MSLDGAENVDVVVGLEPPAGIVATAVAAGAASPCAKSKRGVVIWARSRDHSSLKGACIEGSMYAIQASAHNARPDVPCDDSVACFRDCGKVAVHAEEAAILKCTDWFRNGNRKQDVVEMLHVKVINGVAVPGGPPSCWQCSRIILAAKIDYMWLLEDGRGWVRRTAQQFHRETLHNCDLHVPGDYSRLFITRGQELVACMSCLTQEERNDAQYSTWKEGSDGWAEVPSCDRCGKVFDVVVTSSQRR